MVGYGENPSFIVGYQIVFAFDVVGFCFNLLGKIILSVSFQGGLKFLLFLVTVFFFCRLTDFEWLHLDCKLRCSFCV